MNEKVYYVVQVLESWDSYQALGRSLNSQQMSGSVGFMPIFDSWVAANAWKVEHQTTAEIAMCSPVQRSKEG